MKILLRGFGALGCLASNLGLCSAPSALEVHVTGSQGGTVSTCPLAPLRLPHDLKLGSSRGKIVGVQPGPWYWGCGPKEIKGEGKYYEASLRPQGVDFARKFACGRLALPGRVGLE